MLFMYAPSGRIASIHNLHAYSYFEICNAHCYALLGRRASTTCMHIFVKSSFYPFYSIYEFKRSELCIFDDD